jgi:hypothetical protein
MDSKITNKYDLIPQVVANGHFEMLKHIHELCPSAVLSYDVFKAAVDACNIAIIKWLIIMKCPQYPPTTLTTGCQNITIGSSSIANNTTAGQNITIGSSLIISTDASYNVLQLSNDNWQSTVPQLGTITIGNN